MTSCGRPRACSGESLVRCPAAGGAGIAFGAFGRRKEDGRVTSRWTKVADVPAKHAPYQDPCRTQSNMQWPRQAGIGGFFSCGQGICREQREQAPFVFREYGSGRLPGTKKQPPPDPLNAEQPG